MTGVRWGDKHHLGQSISHVGDPWHHLSYGGGIVESLYASNAQVSSEAHGHLGASMSQTGAQYLASQRLPFSAILGSYYTGASLARLKWHDQ